MANPFSEDQNSKQNAPPDVILAILSLQHVLFRYIVVKNSLTLPRALKNKSAVSQENDNILLHVRLNIMRSFDFNIKVKRELSRKHASSTTLLSNCDALCFYFVNENLRHKSPVFRRYTEILIPNLPSPVSLATEVTKFQETPFCNPDDSSRWDKITTVSWV